MAKLAVCVSVMLVLLLAALSESSPRKYCCTQYQETPVPVKRLKSYTVQDDYCKIRAIIFKTVKNRPVCANPDEQWVQEAMMSVSKKP
ncbi:C-C motif chemokine 20 [Archocentrus centrarchus]|uniref:C-C motif chemokine 20 n=1 Tax=Archocentrus centrarchus TaxID=63155 RepID=UPI0011EA005C|nr:C-C motif chemokine 20-like [Archocentrus centrarchus]